MDNLNTHRLSSLYEAFEPAEGGRGVSLSGSDTLHFQTRELAEHGGDRAQRSGSAVLGESHTGQGGCVVR